jgi:multiple sugar transport system ATP-binding protein
MEIVQKGTSHLEATLYSIELTGDQTIVTSKMGSNFVTINEDKDFESNLDLPVKIKLDKAKIFFFDSLSGKRIRS